MPTTRSHRDFAIGVVIFTPFESITGIVERVIDAIDIRDPQQQFDQNMAEEFVRKAMGSKTVKTIDDAVEAVPYDLRYALHIALGRRAFFVRWYSSHHISTVPRGYWVDGDGEPYNPIEQERLDRCWHQGTQFGERPRLPLLLPEIITSASDTAIQLGCVVKSSEHAYTGTVQRKIVTPDNGTWWRVSWDEKSHPSLGEQDFLFAKGMRNYWFSHDDGVVSIREGAKLDVLWDSIARVMSDGVCIVPKGFELAEFKPAFPPTPIRPNKPASFA
jgi:hypothetical protein